MQCWTELVQCLNALALSDSQTIYNYLKVSQVSDEWKDLYLTIGLTGAHLEDENIISTVMKVVERYGGIQNATKELTIRRKG